MKRMGTIIVVILVLLVVLVSAKNIIAKNAVQAAVKAITGLNLSMKSLNVGIFKSLISINGLKLYNPVGFTDKLMVDIPEIYVDYDLGAFFKKKIHLEEMRLNLKEFIVVKNKEGQLNLDALKAVQTKKEEKPAQEKKEKAQMPELKIDLLELKIGKALFKDYSQGTQPKVKEFSLNINERYENITDPYALVSLIVTKALINTTIGNLANFDLGPLKEEMGQTLKKATEQASGMVSEVFGVQADTQAKAEESIKKETEKAADTLKNILPFGK